jgi:hypothetical protein
MANTQKITTTKLVHYTDNTQTYAVSFGSKPVGHAHVSYGVMDTEVTATNNAGSVKTFTLLTDALSWLSK